MKALKEVYYISALRVETGALPLRLKERQEPPCYVKYDIEELSSLVLFMCIFKLCEMHMMAATVNQHC